MIATQHSPLSQICSNSKFWSIPTTTELFSPWYVALASLYGEPGFANTFFFSLGVQLLSGPDQMVLCQSILGLDLYTRVSIQLKYLVSNFEC